MSIWRWPSLCFFLLFCCSAATSAQAADSWFGVGVRSHAALNEREAAVKLVAIHPLGPVAGKAPVNTLVYRVGGQRVRNAAEFVNVVRAAAPGGDLTMEAQRPGALRRSYITVRAVKTPDLYTVPSNCPAGMTNPPPKISFYTVNPKPGDFRSPVDAELQYVKALTGCSLPADVADALRKLFKISVEHKVVYSDLVKYALTEAGRRDRAPQTAAQKSYCEKNPGVCLFWGAVGLAAVEALAGGSGRSSDNNRSCLPYGERCSKDSQCCSGDCDRTSTYIFYCQR